MAEAGGSARGGAGAGDGRLHPEGLPVRGSSAEVTTGPTVLADERDERDERDARDGNEHQRNGREHQHGPTHVPNSDLEVAPTAAVSHTASSADASPDIKAATAAWVCNNVLDARELVSSPGPEPLGPQHRRLEGSCGALCNTFKQSLWAAVAFEFMLFVGLVASSAFACSTVCCSKSAVTTQQPVHVRTGQLEQELSALPVVMAEAQAMANPTRPVQAMAVPAQLVQAMANPTQPVQAMAVPAQPVQAMAVPAQPVQAMVVPAQPVQGGSMSVTTAVAMAAPPAAGTAKVDSAVVVDAARGPAPRFCGNCGGALADGAHFCAGCGQATGA
jgi:hypothetical protein